MKNNFHQITPGMVNLLSQVKLSGNPQPPLFTRSSNTVIKGVGGKISGKLYVTTSYKQH
ncbi:hypothetical protein [Desulforamulus ferrireducens]|uniref:hypothetical protein n=1 Tax=Desulforamulus ferrireducens TaxID=1833852 RepID=UPI0013567216|nr:hypothetical protein [Desulforamulus ferrireducens]